MEKRIKWIQIVTILFLGTWFLIDLLQLAELQKLADYFINYVGLG